MPKSGAVGRVGVKRDAGDRMSEYTDFYAVRVPDPTGVVAALQESGAAGIVFDDLVGTVTSPVWVALALDSGEAALTRLGPAIHMRVNEDGHGWQLRLIAAAIRCFTFFGPPVPEALQRSAGRLRPGGPAPISAGDAELLHTTFVRPWPVLEPTLVAGGFEPFCAVTGVPFLLMLDQHGALLDLTFRAARPDRVILASTLG